MYPAGVAASTFDTEFARGSELLRSGQLAEAQVALRAALELQPGAPRVLALLGLTHFRSGEFEQAREVYQALVERVPDDASHWLNLGLVHLKLGDADPAIDALETSRSLDPSQGRAANYLGLAYARAGRFVAAYEAFLLAGQHELASEVEGNLTAAERAEVAARLSGEPASAEAAPETIEAGVQSGEFVIAPLGTSPASSASQQFVVVAEAPPAAVPTEPQRGDTAISRAVAHAVPSSAGTISRAALGGQGPISLSEFATARLVRPDDGTAPFEISGSGVMVVRVDGKVFSRTEGVDVSSGKLTYEPAMRRTRGTPSDEPFDTGGRPMFEIAGRGYLIASPQGETFTAVQLDDDVLYLREELVFAFQHDIRWEAGAVPGSRGQLRMVQFRGAGALAIRTRRPLIAIKLVPPNAVLVDAGALAGWIGRIVPRACKPQLPANASHLADLFLECTGEGVLLIEEELPRPAAPAPAPNPDGASPEAPAAAEPTSDATPPPTAADLLGNLDDDTF